MTKSRKTQIKLTYSQPPKRDMMTEMFEHFGIKVVDVTPERSNHSRRKVIK